MTITQQAVVTETSPLHLCGKRVFFLKKVQSKSRNMLHKHIFVYLLLFYPYISNVKVYFTVKYINTVPVKKHVKEFNWNITT